MYPATIKNNKIIGAIGKFQGSATTIQEYIVAMIAQKQTKKHKHSANEDSGKERKFTKRETVPFLTHYQNSEKINYKVGDKKEYKGYIYFFRNCSDYRNHLK